MGLNTIFDDFVESKVTDLRDEALYALCDIVLNLSPSATGRYGPKEHEKLSENYGKLHNFMRAMEARNAKNE